MINLTFMHLTADKKLFVRRVKPAAVISGLAWAFSITLAACILMYAWVVLSAGPVYNLGAHVIAGAVLGALAGGIAAGRVARALGLLHGLLTGLCYGLVLMALFIAGSREVFSPAQVLLRVLFLGLTGALGGLLGINIPFMVNRKPVQDAGKKFFERDSLFPRRD